MQEDPVEVRYKMCIKMYLCDNIIPDVLVHSQHMPFAVLPSDSLLPKIKKSRMKNVTLR